jgi:hypothetical protein
MIKYFVFEYEDNEDNKLVELTQAQFDKMTTEFDREQVEMNIRDNIEYCKSNNIESVISLSVVYDIQSIIHQDSERDIYIVE